MPFSLDVSDTDYSPDSLWVVTKENHTSIPLIHNGIFRELNTTQYYVQRAKKGLQNQMYFQNFQVNI